MSKSVINRVFNEDARNILKYIPKNIKIDSTITSPPYYDMKDYESEGQIGFGQSYEDYLDDLKRIFKSVFDVTKDDGTLWIVIDSFKRNNQVVTLPFNLSDKLKEVGWMLQDVIIWKKDKTVPWSSNGFMQRKFEYILFFSKSKKFKSNKDSVRSYDTSQLKRWWVKYPERYNPKGKALDEIWEYPIPVQGSWGDEYIRHFCPLPKEMVATMIKISTDEGDVILDPFAGTGTVLSQSAFMERKYIGFELNPSYIAKFEEYITKSFDTNRSEYQVSKKSIDQNSFEEMILKLRVLKFARVLMGQLDRDDVPSLGSNYKIIVKLRSGSSQKNKLVQAEYEIVSDLGEDLDLQLLIDHTLKKPLSKFGVEPIFRVLLNREVNYSQYYQYTKGNTHSYVKNAELIPKISRIFSDICVDLNENDYL